MMESIGWRLWTIFCWFRGRRRGLWWRRRKIKRLKESLAWKAQDPFQTTKASQATRKENKESVFSFLSAFSCLDLLDTRRAACGGGIRIRTGECTTHKICSRTLVVYWSFDICLPSPSLEMLSSLYMALYTSGQTVSQTLNSRCSVADRGPWTFSASLVAFDHTCIDGFSNTFVTPIFLFQLAKPHLTTLFIYLYLRC